MYVDPNHQPQSHRGNRREASGNYRGAGGGITSHQASLGSQPRGQSRGGSEGGRLPQRRHGGCRLLRR